jgi:hypothetical protein
MMKHRQARDENIFYYTMVPYLLFMQNQRGQLKEFTKSARTCRPGGNCDGNPFVTEVMHERTKTPTTFFVSGDDL